MQPSQKKIISANLDLLRAVAVTLVLFDHICGTLHNRSFGSLGRFGVLLFFVHTSFVLMASLHRLERPGVRNRALAYAFWVRRFFRIYPLAVLFVVLTPLFRIPASPSLTYAWIGLRGFLSNLALTQNLTYSPNILSPLWSLPLEVQMYLLLPFAYFAIRDDRSFRSLPLWVLSVVLALIAPRISARLIVFLYAPCFTSGIVAYDLLRSQTWKWKLPSWVWPVGICAAIALFGPHDNISLPHKLLRAWTLMLLLGVLYANVKEIPSIGIERIFHWIAEHSYGIYLSHIVVLWIVFYRMGPFPLWAQVAVAVAITLAVSALLYVTPEKPLVLTGAKIAKRLLARSAASEPRQPD